MRILIACERYGNVRDAFRKKGHDAVSCDVLPSVAGGPHIEGDALSVLHQKWDMMIAHPPCTYLSGSGLHWNARRPGRAQKTEAALALVREFMDAPIPRIAIENPVGCISTRIRPLDQSIQPYEFGADASKRTCLWLKGLPPLIKRPEDRVPGRMVEWPAGSGRMVERWANQTDSGQNRLPPSANRWALRSITYPGIAAAMAEQWGSETAPYGPLFGDAA